jgi:hypothetical protein
MGEMILPKVRDPRFVTVRRHGSLLDADHHLLAIWAADCAEHVLHLFEGSRPGDDRPRRAIELARAWARGEVTMTQARTAAGHANAAARDLSGAPRHAAFAAAQAAAVAHVAAHELGAAAYAIKAAQAADPHRDAARRAERDWQRDRLPNAIRDLVLDDQRLRNHLCWDVFEG